MERVAVDFIKINQIELKKDLLQVFQSVEGLFLGFDALLDGIEKFKNQVFLRKVPL